MDDAADGKFLRRLYRVARYRRWILGGAVLSSLVVLGISLVLPKIYRATTYVLVSEPKIGSALPSGVWQYALIRTYVPFVDSDALIAYALRDLKLDQPPYNLTLEEFRKRDYLDVDIPKNTPVTLNSSAQRERSFP